MKKEKLTFATGKRNFVKNIRFVQIDQNPLTPTTKKIFFFNRKIYKVKLLQKYIYIYIYIGYKLLLFFKQHVSR